VVDGKDDKKTAQRAARTEKAKSIKTDMVPGAAGPPTTHGASLLKNLDQTDWPPAIRRLYSERYNELAQLPHLDAAKHRGLIHQICWLEILAGVVRQWTLEHGAITGENKLQPVLREVLGWERLLGRAYATAGLTPASQSAIKVPEKSLTEWLEEVDTGEDDDGGGGSK
jgi:hypothetical protein